MLRLGHVGGDFYPLSAVWLELRYSEAEELKSRGTSCMVFRRLRIGILLTSLAVAFIVAMQTTTARGAEIAPTPFDQSHLIVVKPENWRDGKGASAKIIESSAGVFEKSAIAIGEPVTAR